MQEQVFNKRPMVDVLSEQLGKRVVMSGDNYVYLDTKEEVAMNEIKVAIEELENDRVEWEALQYVRDRLVEYAKLNQDEMRFDDLENSTTTWQDSINAIKLNILARVGNYD